MTNRCKICNMLADGEFCELHKKAYEKLHREYDRWNKALQISWEEYLEKLKENEYTGVAIKEIIDYLLDHSS